MCMCLCGWVAWVEDISAAAGPDGASRRWREELARWAGQGAGAHCPGPQATGGARPGGRGNLLARVAVAEHEEGGG
jgi:hypothetical protein